MIIKFQNQVYHIIDRITKVRLKRPEVFEKEIVFSRFKETGRPIQLTPIQRVKNPVKPQQLFQFLQPVSNLFNNYFQILINLYSPFRLSTLRCC